MVTLDARRTAERLSVTDMYLGLHYALRGVGQPRHLFTLDQRAGEL